MKGRENILTHLRRMVFLMAGISLMSSCVRDDSDYTAPTTGNRIGFSATSNEGVWEADKTRSGLGVAQSPQRLYSTDGEMSIDIEVEEGIRATKPSAPLTRGSQINAKGEWSYRVSAYYTYDSDNGRQTMNFFTKDPGGFLTLESDATSATTNYYWPPEGQMDFWAVAPVVEDLSFPEEPTETPSLIYTIPTDVADQQDIMVAHTVADCSAAPTPVGLEFQHLLAAVQFKVGKMVATRINSLTISGVKGGEVTMTYDNNNGTWSYSTTEENASYSPIYLKDDGTPNVDTYGMAEGNYITSNDNGLTMLVMPQELNGAKVSINYTELITGTTPDAVEATLTGHSWEAGKTTTYVLNVIAETLQITIPTPPDADAHYVRIDMPYDLTGLNEYAGAGITISDVTATASWVEDDESKIFMKTSLTEMQSKGYFTDELWTLEYSVNKDGTTDPANPVAVKSDENILGTDTLPIISGSSGTIYLFLDENNGTTDRNGVLKLTAKVTQNENGEFRTVTLAQGNFKQLCPSWNGTTAGSIGVERFEDAGTSEDAGKYPYGFSYNRVVKYTNSQAVTYKKIYEEAGPFWALGYRFILWLFGAVEDSVIPDVEGQADGFVTSEEFDGFTVSITLNYGALNKLYSADPQLAADNDGLVNTAELYNYTGATDIAELENQLDEAFEIETSGSYWGKETINEGTNNPSDYAAFIALTRNRMRELRTAITSSEGTTTTYKALLHEDSEGNDIIEWYLPSIVEAQGLKETGTGTETTPISPLDGEYWSSTAGEDPSDTNANGYANSFTFTNNIIPPTTASTTDRTKELKVRAVRKKP